MVNDVKKTDKKLIAGKKSGCEGSAGAHKSCPVFLTLSLIANKWSIQLLHHLLQAEKHTLRFSQLQKLLTGISHRELSKHLREFEKSAIVGRTVFPEVPPRVEYTLTSIGKSLFEPIEALSRWALTNGEKVQKKRAEFDRKTK